MRAVLSPRFFGRVAVVVISATCAPAAWADEATWRQHLENGKRAGNARDYKVATESFRLALKEAEAFGPTDPRLGETWNLLGTVYTAQLHLDEAVSALKRALGIRKAALGASHAETLATRANLANAYFIHGLHSEAEDEYKTVVAAIESRDGPEAPALERVLMSLSTVYVAQRRLADAESLTRRALAISEKNPEGGGPGLPEHLHQLASLLEVEKKYEDAAIAAERARNLNKVALGPAHPKVGISLMILGRVRTSQGSYEEACRVLQEALTVLEPALGARHPFVVDTLSIYAKALKKSGRKAEATEIERRLKGPDQ